MIRYLRATATRFHARAVALWTLVMAILGYSALTIVPKQVQAEQYCCGEAWGCAQGEWCSWTACSGVPGTRMCQALS